MKFQRFVLWGALFVSLLAAPAVALAAPETASAQPAPTSAANPATSGGSTTTVQFQLPEQDKLNRATADSVGYLFTDSASPFASMVNNVFGWMTQRMYGYLTVIPRLIPSSGNDAGNTTPENIILPPALLAAAWRVGFVFTLLLIGFDLVFRATRQVIGTITGESHTYGLASDLVNLLLSTLASFLSFRAMDAVDHLINLLDNLLFLAADSVGPSIPSANAPFLLGAINAVVNGFALWKALGFLAIPLALAALLATLAMWAAEIGRLAILLFLTASAPFGVFCLVRGSRKFSDRWTSYYLEMIVAAPITTVLLILIQLALTTAASTLTSAFGAPVVVVEALVIIATIGLIAGTNLWFLHATFGQASAAVSAGSAVVSTMLSAVALSNAARWAAGARAALSASGTGAATPALATATSSSGFPRIGATSSSPSSHLLGFEEPVGSSPVGPSRESLPERDDSADPRLGARLADALSMNPSTAPLGRALTSQYGSARQIAAQAARDTQLSGQREADRVTSDEAAQSQRADRSADDLSRSILRSWLAGNRGPSTDADIARTMGDLAKRGQAPQTTSATFQALDDALRAMQYHRQTQSAGDNLAPGTPDGIQRANWEDNDVFAAAANPIHSGAAHRAFHVGMQDLESGVHSPEARWAVAGALRAVELNRGSYQFPHYVAARRLFRQAGISASPAQTAETAQLMATSELRTARSMGWFEEANPVTEQLQDYQYYAEAAHDLAVERGERALVGSTDPVAAVQAAYRLPIGLGEEK
ncbi:MAG: hypothetical protein KGJ86_00875 [Chloroflexota bacterium]|nr:hypothetical protein [Chloroflexota bacterium]